MASAYVLLSFAAMAGWGLTDFLAKSLVRSMGSRKAAFFNQFFSAAFSIAGALLLAGAAAAAPVPFPLVRFILLCALSSVFGAAAWAAFYKGMSDGKLSLLQPVSSLWVIITLGLSLTLLHERLAAAGALGVCIALAGLIFLSWPPEGIGKKLDAGVLPGLVAMLCWGLGMFVTKLAVDAGGPFVTAASINSIQALIFLAFLRWSPAAPQGRLRASAGMRLAALMGFVNAAAYLSYNSAISKIGASIPSAIIAVSPVLVIFLSRMFYKERLTRLQTFGAILAVFGAVLVSI